MRNPSDPVTPPEPRPLTAEELRTIHARHVSGPSGKCVYDLDFWPCDAARLAEARALPSGPGEVVSLMENEGVVAWGDDQHRQRFLATLPAADGRHPDHACGQTPCPHIEVARALPSTPTDRAAALTGDTDDLMQLLATEGDPRFADVAGRAYIRIRTLQAALATPAVELADPAGLDVERLAPLIEEVYQRGLDGPEAAEYIAAEYARLGEPR